MEQHYKLNWYEWLFVIMASSMPLQFYSVSFAGLSLSLDRAILGALLCALPLYMRSRGVTFFWPQFIAVGAGFSVFLAVLVSGGIDFYAIRFIPSLMQGYAILALGALVFMNNPRATKIVTLVFVSWAILFGLFSVHMYYYYYIKVVRIVPFPLVGDVTEYSQHMLSMMRDRRLFMPLSSAPHLGMVTGFISVWGLIGYVVSRRVSFLLLAATMLCICVLAFSRGPVLVVACSAFILLSLGSIVGALRLDKRLIFISMLVFFLVGAFYLFIQVQLNTWGTVKSDRLVLNFEEILYGRHLMLRLGAFDLYAQGSVVQMLFGQGFGAFAKSGFGDYSFASYLTLLVELGLAGALIFTLIFVVPVVQSMRAFIKYKAQRHWSLLIFVFSVFIALSHLFYELKTLAPLWFITAYVVALAQSKIEIVAVGFSWLFKRKAIARRW